MLTTPAFKCKCVDNKSDVKMDKSSMTLDDF